MKPPLVKGLTISSLLLLLATLTASAFSHHLPLRPPPVGKIRCTLGDGIFTAEYAFPSGVRTVAWPRVNLGFLGCGTWADLQGATVPATIVGYAYVRLMYLCPVFLIFPIFSLVTRFTRRQPKGLCAHCGYDLRASPGRCPECGKVPATTV